MKSFRIDWKKNPSTIVLIVISIVIGILAFRFVMPFGSVVRYQFTAGNTDKIMKVNGIEAAEDFPATGSGGFSLVQQIIRKNIATFQLRLLTPTIDGIWVQFRFRGNPKEVKLGVRGSTSEKYLYTPLYNSALESLAWDKIVSEDTILLQKEKVFTTLDAFYKDPPKDKTIVTYYIDPASAFMTGDTSKATASINTLLRGTHTLYTKVTHSPFILSVSKYDGNAYEGEDTLTIEVYKGNQKVGEGTIADDGITDKSQLKSNSQKTDVTIADPVPGIYKIVLKDNSDGADVRISSVDVNQPRLVITSNFFSVDSRPSTLITNNKSVTMQTFHPSSVQTIRLDDAFDLVVKKETVKYTFDLDAPSASSSAKTVTNIRDLHTLFIPKNDVVINGSGVFALDSTSYFDPMSIKTIDLTKISSADKADMIVARYTPVSKDGDWMVAQVFINPKDMKIDGDKLYFSLESPDMESKGGSIDLDTLNVTLTKPSWGGKSPTVTAKPNWLMQSPWTVISRLLSSIISKQ